MPQAAVILYIILRWFTDTSKIKKVRANLDAKVYISFELPKFKKSLFKKSYAYSMLLWITNVVFQYSDIDFDL